MPEVPPLLVEIGHWVKIIVIGGGLFAAFVGIFWLGIKRTIHHWNNEEKHDGDH